MTNAQTDCPFDHQRVDKPTGSVTGHAHRKFEHVTFYLQFLIFWSCFHFYGTTGSNHEQSSTLA